MSAAAEVAAWLGPARDATLMSYLLPAETPPAAIRAALARAAADEPPGPRAAVVARRDALLALDADDEGRALDEVLAAEPRFRALAAWALGRRATAAAVAALGAAIAHDPDPVARQAALRALGAAGAAAAGLAGPVAALAADEAAPAALRALARRVAERVGPVAEPAAAQPTPAPVDAEPTQVVAEPTQVVAEPTPAPEGAAPEPEPTPSTSIAGSPIAASEPAPLPPTSDSERPIAASEPVPVSSTPAPEPAPVPAASPADAPATAPAAPLVAREAGPDAVEPVEAAPEPEPLPDDPLLAAFVAIRPGFTGQKLRARVVHALALQGFAIDADVEVPDRGDGRPGAIDLVATRGDTVIALVLGDELPAYPALLALAQVQATARGVVVGAAGLTHVPEFADWLVAGGRWRLKA